MLITMYSAARMIAAACTSVTSLAATALTRYVPIPG